MFIKAIVTITMLIVHPIQSSAAEQEVLSVTREDLNLYQVQTEAGDYQVTASSASEIADLTLYDGFSEDWTCDFPEPVPAHALTAERCAPAYLNTPVKMAPPSTSEVLNDPVR